MICDILARNLLLPESLLSGRQHRRASQIDFILSIAETAQVSVKNVFLRLAELRKIGTQRSVILLRTANNETARNAWHIVARKCSGRLPRGPFKPGKDLMLNGLNLPAGPQMHESKQWRVCIDLAQRSWNLQLEFSESSPEWLLLFLEPAEQLYLFDF